VHILAYFCCTFSSTSTKREAVVFTKQKTFTKLQSRTEVILRPSAAFNLHIFWMVELLTCPRRSCHSFFFRKTTCMKRFMFKRQNIHTIEIFVDPNPCGDYFFLLCDNYTIFVKSCLHSTISGLPNEEKCHSEVWFEKDIVPSYQSPFT
jgi:hypothetical protein